MNKNTLLALDRARLRLSAETDPATKAEWAQFLTPSQTARFMADMFPSNSTPACRLLDPGAGIGSLSAAFLERWINDDLQFESIELTACEIDGNLVKTLQDTIAQYQAKRPFEHTIVTRDFIEEGVRRLSSGKGISFTHAIINPPYKKINSASQHRRLLGLAGIETVNLYAAFIALSVRLLAHGGHLVAIVPRSFCNGPYYRSFREFILERTAIRRIHLFGSRTQTFKDDRVLQENIIIHLERGGKQHDVTISTSHDDAFLDLASHVCSFRDIVATASKGLVIHIPTPSKAGCMRFAPNFNCGLEDIGVSVSTGPVVDFRVREHLSPMPENGTVPLLYPCHFKRGKFNWPQKEIKKPNAIRHNQHTEKWLYPFGHYCVVRRFSSKEEKRRIVASVPSATLLPTGSKIGFENHLNVFHENKQGLPEPLAHGLACYLNSSAIDEQFRQFSGHTQVNASDLRMLKYPARNDLMRFGEWILSRSGLTREMIDDRLKLMGS